MYYFEEEIARVTREAGLRGVLGETIIQFPSPDAKTPSESIARAEAFIRDFAQDDLIVPAIAPHSMYTSTRRRSGDPGGSGSGARTRDHPPRGNAG